MSEKSTYRNGRPSILRKWSQLFSRKRTRKEDQDPTECSSAVNVNTNASTYSENERRLSLPGSAHFSQIQKKVPEAVSLKDISQVDDIYVEALSAIYHPILSTAMDKKGSILHLQDAFEIPEERHEKLLKLAKKRKKAQMFINVEYSGVEKHCPLLNLTLLSSESRNIEIKILMDKGRDTINVPIRKEAFYLIELEMWKKEATETKEEKNLVGKTAIPLNEVSISEFNTWFRFVNKNTIIHENIVKVRISFSYRRMTKTSFQHHKELRTILLEHELRLSQMCPYWWSGKFNSEAEYILSQHASQNGLSQVDVDVCSLLSYTEVHDNNAISFEVFSNILSNLTPLFKTHDMDKYGYDYLWDALDTLKSISFNIVRTIRSSELNGNFLIKQVTETLKCLKITNDLVSFKNNEKSLNKQPICDISKTVTEIVTREASKWLYLRMEFRRVPIRNNILRLKSLIELTRTLQEDLELGLKRYNELFVKYLHFDYTKHLYEYYEDKLSGFFEFEVRNIIRNLPQIHYVDRNLQEIPGDSGSFSDDDSLSGGKYVFRLYRNFQRLVNFGKRLYLNEYNFYLENYYQWFRDAIIQWLNVEALTARMATEKAINRDPFSASSTNPKCSSSVHDTVVIFYQIKHSWERLNWPDLNDNCNFLLKIITEIICKCSVFYAEMITNKIEELFRTCDEEINSNRLLCFVINNIEYLDEFLHTFIIQEFGPSTISNHLTKSSKEIDVLYDYETMLREAIEETTTVMRNKVHYLLRRCVDQMTPTINKLVLEMTENPTLNIETFDILLMYIEESMRNLNSLSERNFDTVVNNIWATAVESLNEIAVKDKRRSIFLANLEQILDDLWSIFRKYKPTLDNCSLETLKKQLWDKYSNI